MSIANEISRIKTAKQNIKTSLENKGVPVGDTKIDGYATLIDSIQVGGGDNTLFKDIIERTATNIVIPDYFTSLGASSLLNFNSLESVEIPSSVKSIGEYCFKGCVNLNTVTLNEGLEGVGQYAFQQCHSLSSVIFPDSVTSIGYNVFNATALSKLKYVSVGKNVTELPDRFLYAQAPYYISNLIIDFSRCETIPTLVGTASNTFNVQSLYRIVVPDVLYEDWIVADKWSTIASHIVKKSDYDNQ